MDRFLPAQKSLNWLRAESALGGNQDLKHDIMPIRMPTHHIEYCFFPPGSHNVKKKFTNIRRGEHQRTGRRSFKMVRIEHLCLVPPSTLLVGRFSIGLLSKK
jgi:hypothetical protein